MGLAKVMATVRVHNHTAHNGMEAKAAKVNLDQEELAVSDMAQLFSSSFSYVTLARPDVSANTGVHSNFR